MRLLDTCLLYTSEYYHHIFDEIKLAPNSVENLEILEKIPILDKKTLAESLNSISSANILDYYTVTTGGTCGKPTKVFMEKNAIYKEWAFVYHYWSKFGYDFYKSKLATFRGVDLGEKICEINPLYSEIRLNPFRMNRDNIEAYINRIDKYGADFIYGYPSVIYNFCRLSKEKKISLKGKYKAAFLISENLYQFQRELIQDCLLYTSRCV